MDDLYDLAFTFPALQGIQAGRAYYVAMVRLSHVIRLIDLNRQDLPPELSAQRILNKARIPAIKRYLLDNPTSYVLSSITASVGGEVRFEPVADGPVGKRIGKLTLGADTPVLINDGQHRRAAIEQALEEQPALGREMISVVLFVDPELKRSQQRFADLNRFTVRPAKSISILYDHRDDLGRLVSEIVDGVPAFRTTTEKAKATISNRSRKLFTLSAIYQATKALLATAGGSASSTRSGAVQFWAAVAEQFPDWGKVASGEVHPADLRATYVHAHGVALHAIGLAGSKLMCTTGADSRSRISKLADIDWRRTNAALWEGRALRNGRVSKAYSSIALTADVIRQQLGIAEAARICDRQEQL